MSATGKIGSFFISAFLMVWALIQIFPLYWLFTFSLKDNSEIFSGNIAGLPVKWLWSNYTKALVDAKVGLYLMNSVIVTGITIILTAAFSLMATYALTRMKWKYRNNTLTLFLLGMMIPIHAALLPVFLIMHQLKVLNSYWSLVLPYVAFGIPMAILIFSGFIQTIPRELEEAACIDGCNIYGIFYKIILPLLKPAIANSKLLPSV